MSAQAEMPPITRQL